MKRLIPILSLLGVALASSTMADPNRKEALMNPKDWKETLRPLSREEYEQALRGLSAEPLKTTARLDVPSPGRQICFSLLIQNTSPKAQTFLVRGMDEPIWIKFNPSVRETPPRSPTQGARYWRGELSAGESFGFEHCIRFSTLEDAPGSSQGVKSAQWSIELNGVVRQGRVSKE